MRWISKDSRSQYAAVRFVSYFFFGFSVASALVPTKKSTTAALAQHHSVWSETACGMSNAADEHGESPLFRLGYVTDVEGNLGYFKSFVEQSNVLDLVDKKDEKEIVLELRDGCYFVYGGDAVDKGIGDIRLCRALVSLKKRYPDRVHLLVGNRDLNKLRFSAELSAADMERPVDDIPPPHWDPTAPTLREYLTKKASAFNEKIPVENLNTRVNRLKYILEHTLGCPKTFEFRRQELSILRSCQASDITDEQLVDNFLYEVENMEHGSLRQYLECAKVAVVVGNTLFVHGAVDIRTMQFVPALDSKFENPTTRPAAGKVCDNLLDWVEQLNHYLKDGMRDYQQRPLWDERRTTRGGESLMALQNRPAMWGRSIVSNCYGDGGVIFTDHAANTLHDPARVEQEKTNPLVFEGVSSDPRDPIVAEWLLKHGIQRVVVGHKPTGDCPAVLSSSYTGVEIVSADTSFSDTSSNDNRGVAVANVEIIGRNPIHNRLQLSGRFSDGEEYCCLYPSLKESCTSDENTKDKNASCPSFLLGRQLDGGWWVKAKTATEYQLCRGHGRKVEYKRVAVQDLVHEESRL